MKKNILKLSIILLSIMFLTGCTKTLMDENKKSVKYDAETVCKNCENNCNINENEELKEECIDDCNNKCDLAKKNSTGQVLTENILCRPTNADVIEIYKLNNVNIDKLPSCTDYKINSGGYEGLWTSLFVKPLTWLILKIGSILQNYGLAIILISLAIRTVMMPITKGTAMQSENIKKAQPEINAIEKKYKDKVDQESTMKKSQETMLVYKKYNINPLSSCLFALLQVPLLFGFIEAINRTPAIFEGNFLGLKLGMTPFTALSRGEWWYLIIIILNAIVTLYSFSLNRANPGNQDTQKQMAVMNKVFVVMIVFMSFSLSTAIGIYWISSNAFTIFQNLITDRSGKK